MATFEGSLVAAGYFRTADGAPTDDMAIWDGTSWSPLNGGVPERSSEIYSLAVHDNQLFVGGSFGWLGTEPSAYFARYGCPQCKADCDKSTGLGVLDIFDFLCFQNSFVNSEPYACDCDTSTGRGVCDIFDFLCFQNAFVAGCP